ncbi:hypothetical protein EU537_11545 [Candidatus Thorarchaeota archaeon]|nr:MAG: hypothetical protein EU537_11545 [Candidatus Thorarchaeota archaeon]
MKKSGSICVLVSVVIILMLGSFMVPSYSSSTHEGDNTDVINEKMVDVGGEKIPLAPDESLYVYTLSQAPDTHSGTATAQNASEHGVRVDSFNDISLQYDSATSSTSNQVTQVPMGAQWQGTEMFVNVTNLQENRTWLQNPGFGSTDNWTTGTDDVGIYSNSITSQITGEYAQFTMLGQDSSNYFRFDEGDRAYVEQDISVDRGEVTWAGVSVDYWVYDDWGNPPIGFWELYVQVGTDDVVSNHLWDIQFSDVQSISTWYSSGLVEADHNLINLPNLTIQAGMRTTRTFGARPRLYPEVRLDNIRVFIKARATPSDVNLQVNSLDVLDVENGTHTIWSLGQVTQEPLLPWTSSPVDANFTWTPTPSPPSPDIDIFVTFDAEITLTAEKLNKPTLYQAEVSSYGEHFEVENASQVEWLSYYYVAVPNGYSDVFHFNVTNPGGRIVDAVAEPSKPGENFPYWSIVGDYLNISVYEGVTGSNQNGFWKIESYSSNMISDLRMLSDATWETTSVYRANEAIRLRAQLDSIYSGCTVTYYLYNTTGDIWTTTTAMVNGSGYAESSDIILDATDAEVGYWTVQAIVNDSISGRPIDNIGMYSRNFRIQHSTQMSLTYPKGSESTWTKNLTLGQEMLLQVRVNDSDNADLLPGGITTYNWTTGTQPLSDMGTGEYSVVLDTSDLPGRGSYEITITWSLQHYDPIERIFTINIVEETSLYSPDAPSVETPLGSSATIEVVFNDQDNAGITDATIICNWTDGQYSVSPVAGSPGHYMLNLSTSTAMIDTYAIVISAVADYYITSQTTVFLEVRQLFTSIAVSSSYLPLPVGTQGSITLTYTDTDHNEPITGAAGAISCNWSDYHAQGDSNYTVTEISPGEYRVDFYSVETDFIGSHPVQFQVRKYGAQNHTFNIDVDIQSHLSTFSLVNPIEPTPYTGTIIVTVSYYDVTLETGIGNGTANGHNVLIYILSDEVPGIEYTVYNGTTLGEYIIEIAADQWGSIGWKDLEIFANWTGSIEKYGNGTISTSVRISDTPATLFIGNNPVSTPYGENITFTVFYWDVAADSGIVNSTGPYAFNVSMYVLVLSSGHELNSSLIMVTEIGSGEYEIKFSTNYLSGITTCDLRVYANWTKGELPLYSNASLSVTVRTIYRQTSIEYTPLPITAYDKPVNFTFSYNDVLSSSRIENSSSIEISVSEGGVVLDTYYLETSALFVLSIDTTYWGDVGTFEFHLNVIWSGSPFYQNRTGIAITIELRYRYTSLTHGSYDSVQYSNNLTLDFFYTDLDDNSLSGMDGAELTLDSWLSDYYTVHDNGDGTYTIQLNTTAFASLGIYRVNATIIYGGDRFAANASDYFYLTLSRRRTQLTSDLPDLAPFLTQANITIQYIDDNNGFGIENANVFISSETSAETLEKDVNYWIDSLGDGNYRIRISTEALGTFGSYAIDIIVNYTGSPFFTQRSTSVDIEVSRRPLELSVSESPLNTAYLQNVTFEITVTDSLVESLVSINKSHLVLKHGSDILLLDSEYVLTGSSGVYIISINSTILVAELVQGYPLFVEIQWGDEAPFYSNASASTEVAITARFTQAAVLSTPPAFINFNGTAIIEYTDYLSGDPIAGAQISVSCENVSSFGHWITDRRDGTYEIIINTTDLSELGKYIFLANITYLGSPFYANLTSVQFSLTVNPVSTTLTLDLEPGSTYYTGDTIVVNISYSDISQGIGIEDAAVGTDWGVAVGNPYSLTEIGNGIYQLTLETSGLSAQSYSFSINASKYLHVNRTVAIELLLSPTPISINLGLTPIAPVWGDEIEFVANITDSRDDSPVLGGNVNITLGGVVYELQELGEGLYGRNITSSVVSAGEYAITVAFELEDHESRSRDFSIRIEKAASSLSADIDPVIAVSGQNLTITADYVVTANSTSIAVGTVSFSWTYGQGTLIWNETQELYIGHFIVSDVPAGNHLIIVTAKSANYKSLTVPLNIEIREVTTQIVSVEDTTVVSGIIGDVIPIQVFLNNTDLSLPVVGATLSFSVSDITGNLTETGDGYYRADVNTTGLDLRTWTLTIFGSKPGYTTSSLDFTLDLDPIPTRILVLGDVLQEAYYGENVTFYLFLNDTHNAVGVPDATSTFQLEDTVGVLSDLGNGNYSLVVNTSVVSAGLVPYDITITLAKSAHKQAQTQAKLLVNPITTEVIGAQEWVFPVGDDYSVIFTFNDTLNDVLIGDASSSAIWEFGGLSLANLGNGSYRFGPAETNLSRLEIRNQPYVVRILLTKGNYSTGELVVEITIRAILTELLWDVSPSIIYSGEPFSVTVTYWDLDHDMAVLDASNTTSTITAAGLGLTRLEDEEIDYDNGTYVFRFVAGQAALYSLEITLDKRDYQSSTVSIPIYSEISPEQALLVQTFFNGTLILLVLAALAALYFRVLSIPKLLRKLRSMVSTLEKGRIPERADVNDRRTMLLKTMNENLEPLGIRKVIDDVAPSTLDVSILDVEELLDELAVVVGLTADDLSVLRDDLEKMAPSERAGFIGEVLRQEKSRRAKEIAETAREEELVEEMGPEKLTEEELDDIRNKLMKMGIEEDEVELMVEQARGLTKPEIQALLDQLGGDEE